MPHLLLVGADHRSAPVALRERLHWSEDQRDGGLRALLAGPVREAALLCTCNRTEAYMVADDPAEAVSHVVSVWSARAHDAPAGDLRAHLYTRVGAADVARHLCRVAGGLDALVVGETQVLAQVKDAYLHAAEAGGAGRLLHGLFHHALACSKRVHTETLVAAGAVSVGSAAVEHARAVFGGAIGSAVVLGAGETAETVARRLAESCAGRIVVLSRTQERAADLASRVGGRAEALRELEPALSDADVLVCSVAAETPVVSAGLLSRVMAGRDRPLLVVDLGMPRNVEGAAGAISGVTLCGLSDLEGIAAEGRAARAAEAERAEALIAAEAEAFAEWIATLDAVPLIRALRARFEREAEEAAAAALRRRLSHLPPSDQEAVRQMAAGLARRLLDLPTTRLKDLAGSPDGRHVLRGLSEAFALDVPPVAGLPAGSDPPARRPRRHAPQDPRRAARAAGGGA